MPLFEYSCAECGASFEKLIRSVGSQTEVLCPSCNSGKTQKLMSGFAVSSLGSGPSSYAASAANCAPLPGTGPRSVG